MITTLLTIVRGLRARAMLSVSTFLLVAVAIGAATLGPAFEAASARSYTLTRVAEASEPQTALSWSASPDGPRGRGDLASLTAFETATADVVRSLRPRFYGEPEPTLLTTPILEAGTGTELTLLHRDDVCTTLAIDGDCPASTGEVLLNEDDRFSRRVGDVVRVPRVGRLRIVGFYEPPDESGDWLFPGTLASRPAGSAAPYRPGPYLVARETIARLPTSWWRLTVDSRLRLPAQLTDDGFDTLVAEVAQARTPVSISRDGVTVTPNSPVNALESVLVDVRAQRSAASDTVAPAVASLVLVALAMLARLQSAAAGMRTSELGLASLRGVGRRRRWVLRLAEPLLLLAAAAPLGLAAGWCGARLLAAAWLRDGLRIDLPGASLAAAGAVTLAVAGLAAFSVAGSARSTLAEQLAGTQRPARSGRTARLLEPAVALAAAALAFVRLTDEGGLDLSALLLPVAAAVAAGLVATRALRAAAAWWVARGPGDGVAGFLAIRGLARRTSGTLVLLPVTAALAVSVFAVSIDSAAGRWRESVADTRAPADVVYETELSPDAALALTREIDPDGRWLMAGARLALPDTGVLSLVDAGRLARVGRWQDAWTPGRSVEDVAALVAPAAPFPRFSGTSLAVEFDAPDSAPEIDIVADLVAADGSPLYAHMVVAPGAGRGISQELGACAAGCEIRRLSLDGAGPGTYSLSALEADGVAVPDALSGWAPDAVGIDVDAGAAALRVVADGTAPVELVGAPLAGPLLLVAGSNASATLTSTEIAAPAVPVAARVAGRSRSLPLVGPTGALADLASMLARYTPPPALVEVVVYARQDTPPAVTGALLDRGVTVQTTHAGVREELDAGAYAVALRLYLVVGVLVLVLAVGGLMVSLAVQRPERRRDAAALRVVGVSRRKLLAAGLWENVLVLGVSLGSGLGAGWLTQRILLGSLTLGIGDDPTVPDVTLAPDGVRLLLLAVAASAVLLLIAVVASWSVVRRARGAILREEG